MPDAEIVIHQVFYDEATRRSVRPGFVALDNTGGPPDWYELWPMVRHLRGAELRDDVWYGFVSPKFPEKTGLPLERIHEILPSDPAAEVGLFSSFWPTLALYRNVWIHGDRLHPGLLAASEQFLAATGATPALAGRITDFDTAAYSNNVIARPRFWREWLALAEAYIDHVGSIGAADATAYGPHGTAAMRTFVQERFVAWILLGGEYRVVRPDYVAEAPLDGFAGADTALTRRLFREADAGKAAARRGSALGLARHQAARAILSHVVRPLGHRAARRG